MSSINEAAASDPHHPTSYQQPLNRACESCRSLKVRCLLDSTSSTVQCQRCTKARRSCVFAVQQRKRPRRRMDVRVAELERELNAMRALLKASTLSENRDQVRGEKIPPDFDGNDGAFSDWKDMRNEKSSLFESRKQNELDDASIGNISWPRYTSFDINVENTTLLPQDLDVVDQGIISIDAAEKLVAIYNDRIVPFYPAVILPQGNTCEELRKSKPVLFLAVLAAAALGGDDAQLARSLNDQVLRTYADRIFIKSEKSLELVQSLLITVAYYYPPNSVKQLQFYQYTHIAATMAIDIGIGSKLGPLNEEERAVHDKNIAHTCRAILMCYVLTAGIAVKFRRPPMLLFNKWMSECLNILKASPSILDGRIAAWVELQRIADETSTSFGFDDPSTEITLDDARLQVVIKTFERKMDDWKKTTGPEILNTILQLESHTNGISVYQFAIDGGKHDSQDFQRQHFSLPALDEVAPSQPPPSTVQVNATMKCISSTHAILDVFQNIPTEQLQTMPGLIYVRSSYALVALLQISFPISRKESGLGDLIEYDDLKIDAYMKMISERFTSAVGGTSNRRVPTHWLKTLTKLQDWQERHRGLRQGISPAISTTARTKATISPLGTSSQVENDHSRVLPAITNADLRGNSSSANHESFQPAIPHTVMNWDIKPTQGFPPAIPGSTLNDVDFFTWIEDGAMGDELLQDESFDWNL